MNITKTLYVADRELWREWLAANFQKEKEIWLIFPAKNSSRPRILYNDAVEEALSFGWIDSTVKKYDEHSTAQRFSPRNPGREYSQSNKERLKWLSREGKLHASVRKSIEKVLQEEFVAPADILRTIQRNSQAWENFRNFSPSYQRIRIAYIEGARNRPNEFKRRLNNFIKKTEQNKLIGFGGKDKYY